MDTSTPVADYVLSQNALLHHWSATSTLTWYMQIHTTKIATTNSVFPQNDDCNTRGGQIHWIPRISQRRTKQYAPGSDGLGARSRRCPELSARQPSHTRHPRCPSSGEAESPRQCYTTSSRNTEEDMKRGGMLAHWRARAFASSWPAIKKQFDFDIDRSVAHIQGGAKRLLACSTNAPAI